MSKNIILSPHLDDAVLDCWHLLIQPTTAVATIFSGIPPEGTTALWDRVCGEADSHRMVQNRLVENENAIAISGNHNPQLFLDLLELQYRPKGDRPTAEQLADKVEGVTLKNSTYFAPLAISRVFRHPDHVLIRKMGLEMHKRGHKVGFFPDYPYMSSPHSPKGSRLKRMQALAEKVLGLPLTMSINYISDEDLMKRHMALKAYKSQFAPMNVQTLGGITRLVRRNYELLLYPA